MLAQDLVDGLMIISRFICFFLFFNSKVLLDLGNIDLFVLIDFRIELVNLLNDVLKLLIVRTVVNFILRLLYFHDFLQILILTVVIQIVRDFVYDGINHLVLGTVKFSYYGVYNTLELWEKLIFLVNLLELGFI